jgi:hypothetical protein
MRRAHAEDDPRPPKRTKHETTPQEFVAQIFTSLTQSFRSLPYEIVSQVIQDLDPPSFVPFFADTCEETMQRNTIPFDSLPNDIISLVIEVHLDPLTFVSVLHVSHKLKDLALPHVCIFLYSLNFILL